MLWLIVLLIIVIISLAIPLSISYLLYRFIIWKGFDKRLRLLAFAPILIFAYFIFFAFYPDDDFYRVDFKEVTGMEAPIGAEMIYKSASFPDHFGDYCSVAIMRIDEEFTSELVDQLLDKGFTDQVEIIWTSELNQALAQVDENDIERQLMKSEPGLFYYIGFLSKRNIIIVYRLSW